jgi:hypothetical protein
VLLLLLRWYYLANQTKNKVCDIVVWEGFLITMMMIDVSNVTIMREGIDENGIVAEFLSVADEGGSVC